MVFKVFWILGFLDKELQNLYFLILHFSPQIRLKQNKRKWTSVKSLWLGSLISSHSRSSLRGIISSIPEIKKLKGSQSYLPKVPPANFNHSNPGLNPNLMLFHLHSAIFKASIYTNFTKHFHMDFLTWQEFCKAGNYCFSHITDKEDESL